MTDPLVLAYLAGIVDADGFVTIHRSARAGRLYHAPAIGIAGTDPTPHKMAAALWGGKVRRYEPANPRYRAQYQWQRQGRAAVMAIQALRPFLRIKAAQADLALELAEHLAEAHDEDPYPWAPAGWDPTSVRETMRAEMVELHTRRRPA